MVARQSRIWWLILFCIICTPQVHCQHNEKLDIQSHIEKGDAIFDSLFDAYDYEGAYQFLKNDFKTIVGDSAYNAYYYRVLRRLMRIKYRQGDYFTAIEYSNELLGLYKERSLFLANTYVYIAHNYYEIGELGIAIDYYYKARELYDELGNKSHLGPVLLNIANMHQRAQNFDLSNQFYLQGVENCKQYHPQLLGTGFANYGRYFLLIGQLANCKAYLDSALVVAIKFHQKDAEVFTLRMIGELEVELNNLEEAKKYFLQTMQLSDSINNNLEFALASNLLAKIYNDEGNYQKAIQIGQVALFELNQNTIESVTTIRELLKSYTGLGDLENLKMTQALYEEMSETLKSKEIEQEALKFQIRHEVEQKASENKLLKQQDQIQKDTIRAQRFVLIAAIVGFILILAIALIIYRAYVINKRLSVVIKSKSDKLKQLDEAKSRFFANISHDLRSPLTLIMGGIEQVLKSKDVYLTGKAEKQLRNGYLNSERIMHLTNEINELIKLEDGNLGLTRKYIDLDKFLKLFISMFQSMSELKNINLSYSKSIFAERPIVNIDPKQFEKVIFNLVTNALKHTQPGESISLVLNKDNQNLKLSVIDSGAGIPEENLPYIFERYYQAPKTTFKTQEGFGIGLALVNEIITKHKAKIEVMSKLHEGSEFIITLPLEEVEEDKISSLAAFDYSVEKRNLCKNLETIVRPDVPTVSIAGSGETEEKPTILIVEDHPDVRDYIEDIIAPHFNVITAFNGSKALKILDKVPIDLVVTDLMMPWFDGFELLEKLKEDERFKKIPALVVSARTTEEDKNKVLSSGVNDFLCKPFQAGELLQRINNLLERKQLWNNEADGALIINNQQTIHDIESSLIKKVESIVISRVADPNLSVAVLANEIATSERNIYRLIKKITQVTPYKYIKEVRFQYVQKLLREKKISNASEAAKAIGMNNVSHFSSQFKKRFGKTPDEVM